MGFRVNLNDVVNEVRQALDSIDGLSVPEWGVQLIQPPAALVALPERIDYDQTYVRGVDQITDLPVLVLVARPTEPESRRVIAAYADGSGPRSVKAAIEGRTYVSCDDVTVVWAEFEAVTYAGTEYLACVFHLDITGKGA